jgi:hypothetical protein
VKLFVEASRLSRIELEKQGTPDYDPRAHELLVEEQRKLAQRMQDDDDT